MNRTPVLNDEDRAAYGDAPVTDVNKQEKKAAPIYKRSAAEKRADPAPKPKAKK